MFNYFVTYIQPHNMFYKIISAESDEHLLKIARIELGTRYFKSYQRITEEEIKVLEKFGVI